MRALCLLRRPLAYRRDATIAGLRVAGYQVVDDIQHPRHDDVLVTWNRYGDGHRQACRFEQAGARVVVMENGYLGKSWMGDTWFAMALDHHAGRGRWPGCGVGPYLWTAQHQLRWDGMSVPLAPWRDWGGEVIVLHQRGIGEVGIASPRAWAETMAAKIKGSRIRTHPAAGNPIELEHDVRNASAVVTWASAAALRCLAMGIPVWYHMPGWIGEAASRHMPAWPEKDWGGPLVSRSDDDRLRMFRRLAWAQWRLSEIEDGSAFKALLGV